MKKRILVAYASGSGSTAEVAQVIAEELESDDVQVEAISAREVQDIEAYSAVVLGSSIRTGRWLATAIDFLAENARHMESLPVAYFTTCMTLAEESEESYRIVEAYMEPILALAPTIEPVGLGLFAGSLGPAIQAILPSGSPYGDYRDWQAIREWARDIKPELYKFSGKRGGRLILSGSILSYSDLSEEDLSGTNLRGSDLRQIKLKKAKLQGTDLVRSKLTRADLSRADLQEANLGWADLDGCDLEKSNLRNANLIGAKLREANLKAANLEQAILNGADLSNADMSESRLTGADLNWAVMVGANLSGADLRKANLGWADLRNADLNEAILTKARYNDQTVWPSGFDPDAAGCLAVLGPY